MAIKEAEMFEVDTTTRAGRMLAAGRLTVTFRSLDTGQHITINAKCRKPGENGGPWTNANLADAKVIFFSVPNSGGWADKVGKYTAGRGFVKDPNADAARAFCAEKLVAFAKGEALPPRLEALEEDRCGRCGRALTDPVSIERGIGPECYGKETGSQHQTKNTELEKDNPTEDELRREAAGDARMYGHVFGDGPGDPEERPWRYAR